MPAPLRAQESCSGSSSQPAMMMPLVLRAGASAAAQLRKNGWNWDDFEIFLAASGGPKWLVLSQLDRLFLSQLQNRDKPLHLVGSSSGAFRFAAYIQNDPQKAIANLEQSYVGVDWNTKLPRHRLTGIARAILDGYLQPLEQLNHRCFHLHIITALCQGWTAHPSKLIEAFGLLRAAVRLAWGRQFLAPLAQRYLFSDPRLPLPANYQDLATTVVSLHEANLRDALLASGSIPLLLEGVPLESPVGRLRDGGLVDYHLTFLPVQPSHGLIFYPHFDTELREGYLERLWGIRNNHMDKNLDRAVLLTPSREWLRSLPLGRLPDRKDASMPISRRQGLWFEAARRGQELAEAFQPDKLIEQLQPL